MDTKTILNEATGRMQKAIDHLEEELLNVRAGKASPNALNGVMVDYFGSQVPVSGAASVTVPDARTILIQPWDKNMLRPIEKAIIDSNIGLTPSNNGEQIRLTIPPLTEERRKELVKQVRAEAETARISLRNARRDAVEAFKKAQKEGMPEDESKDGETQSQKLLEKFSKTLDEALSKKEKEIRRKARLEIYSCRAFSIRLSGKPRTHGRGNPASPRQNRQRPAQTDRLRSQTRPHTSAAHSPSSTVIRRPSTVHPPLIRRPSAGPCLFHNIKNPGLQLRKPGFIYLQRLKPQGITLPSGLRLRVSCPPRCP